MEKIPNDYIAETNNPFQALLEIEKEMMPEELWANLKTMINEAASKNFKRCRKF